MLSNCCCFVLVKMYKLNTVYCLLLSFIFRFRLKKYKLFFLFGK